MLDENLWGLVLVNLAPKDFYTATRVCRAWRQLEQDPAVRRAVWANLHSITHSSMDNEGKVVVTKLVPAHRKGAGELVLLESHDRPCHRARGYCWTGYLPSPNTKVRYDGSLGRCDNISLEYGKEGQLVYNASSHGTMSMFLRPKDPRARDVCIVPAGMARTTSERVERGRAFAKTLLRDAGLPETLHAWISFLLATGSSTWMASMFFPDLHTRDYVNHSDVYPWLEAAEAQLAAGKHGE
ncbi:hypothetical protein QOT17_007757 [Balamuthia mandrillaris]